jgi:hypothetical protein
VIVATSGLLVGRGLPDVAGGGAAMAFGYYVPTIGGWLA